MTDHEEPTNDKASANDKGSDRAYEAPAATKGVEGSRTTSGDGRTNTTKSTGTSTEKTAAKGDEKPPAESDEESKPFDFGGLPDRNLKKNLGCG